MKHLMDCNASQEDLASSASVAVAKPGMPSSAASGSSASGLARKPSKQDLKCDEVLQKFFSRAGGRK